MALHEWWRYKYMMLQACLSLLLLLDETLPAYMGLHILRSLVVSHCQLWVNVLISNNVFVACRAGSEDHRGSQRITEVHRGSQVWIAVTWLSNTKAMITFLTILGENDKKCASSCFKGCGTAPPCLFCLWPETKCWAQKGIKENTKTNKM